jgi:hypothetical protein
MKVFVYFNLHRKCFSVKALEGALKGRVIIHASYVNLYNCAFKVSEAGRQRVLREKRKNVHAGVVGNLQSFTFVDQQNNMAEFRKDCTYALAFEKPHNRVKYNPYKLDKFYREEDNACIPVEKHQLVSLAKLEGQPPVIYLH